MFGTYQHSKDTNLAVGIVLTPVLARTAGQQEKLEEEG